MTKTLEPPTRGLPTVDQEVRQKAQEQIDAFTMPRPMKGQSVLWYPKGMKADKAEVGFVLTIGARNIVLQAGNGLARDSVRHIDDPKLKLSSDQRESGAWDFTDDWKANLNLPAKFEALEAKVKKLEELMK